MFAQYLPFSYSSSEPEVSGIFAYLDVVHVGDALVEVLWVQGDLKVPSL